MDGRIPVAPERKDRLEQDRERDFERLIANLPPSLQRAIAWLRVPSRWWIRVPAGLLLLAGSLLFLLPVFGLWMLPLGLVLLAEDVPLLHRLRNRSLDWIVRRHPNWLKEPLR